MAVLTPLVNETWTDTKASSASNPVCDAAAPSAEAVARLATLLVDVELVYEGVASNAMSPLVTENELCTPMDWAANRPDTFAGSPVG